jgi:hypothetical protein
MSVVHGTRGLSAGPVSIMAGARAGITRGTWATPGITAGIRSSIWEGMRSTSPGGRVHEVSASLRSERRGARSYSSLAASPASVGGREHGVSISVRL